MRSTQRICTTNPEILLAPRRLFVAGVVALALGWLAVRNPEFGVLALVAASRPRWVDLCCLSSPRSPCEDRAGRRARRLGKCARGLQLTCSYQEGWVLQGPATQGRRAPRGPTVWTSDDDDCSFGVDRSVDPSTAIRRRRGALLRAGCFSSKCRAWRCPRQLVNSADKGGAIRGKA